MHYIIELMYKQLEGRAQAHEGVAGNTVVGYPQNLRLTLTLGSVTGAHAELAPQVTL